MHIKTDMNTLQSSIFHLVIKNRTVWAWAIVIQSYVLSRYFWRCSSLRRSSGLIQCQTYWQRWVTWHFGDPQKEQICLCYQLYSFPAQLATSTINCWVLNFDLFVSLPSSICSKAFLEYPQIYEIQTDYLSCVSFQYFSMDTSCSFPTWMSKHPLGLKGKRCKLYKLQKAYICRTQCVVQNRGANNLGSMGAIRNQRGPGLNPGRKAMKWKLPQTWRRLVLIAILFKI